MAQLLPEAPSFGAQLARGLGAGFSKEVSDSRDIAKKLALQKAQYQQILGLAGSPEQQTQQSPQMSSQELESTFLEALPQLEQVLGRELQPHEADTIWKKLMGSSQTAQSMAPVEAQPDESRELALDVLAPEVGRGKREREKIRTKKFEAERKYHTDFSKEAEKKASTLRERIPKKEMALNFARNALESEDLSFFSPDKLADVTGIDLFRTAKGAQLVTAGKENLLSNMSRVSAKGQNIWFEQRLNSMFPKIGQSRIANLTVQEMIEAEVAMDKAYLAAYDKIATEDMRKYGYERRDIEKRARDAVTTQDKEIFDRASYRMRELEENEVGAAKLHSQFDKKVPKGTPLTTKMGALFVKKYGSPEKAAKVAKSLGYKVPTDQEFAEYQLSPQEFR